MKTPKRKRKQTPLQPWRAATSSPSHCSASEPKCRLEKSGIVDTLQENYGERLARASQESKADQKRMKKFGGCHSDLILFSKWAYRVGKGWYGFSLGHIPPVWTDLLNDFLSWLEEQCPDFEIHQIKIKINGLRFYVGTKTSLVIPDEAIRAEIRKLEKLLRFPFPRESFTRIRRKKRRTSATKT